MWAIFNYNVCLKKIYKYWPINGWKALILNRVPITKKQRCRKCDYAICKPLGTGRQWFVTIWYDLLELCSYIKRDLFIFLLDMEYWIHFKNSWVPRTYELGIFCEFFSWWVFFCHFFWWPNNKGKYFPQFFVGNFNRQQNND